MSDFEEDLRVLITKDGSWKAVEDAWRRECSIYGEDLEEYALNALPVVKELAENDHPRAQALGLFDDTGRCHAICHANIANIPGYREPVLRVRHLLLSPQYDFGDYDAGTYAIALTSVFAGIVKAAFSTMPAKHIRFHLRSPADVAFFAVVAKTLASLPTFATVQMKGAWLYLELTEMPASAKGGHQ